MLFRSRRDEALDERQGAFGWLWLKSLGFVLLCLLLGLILDGAGIDIGGYIALGAMAIGVMLIWVVPWLGPWR